MRFILFLALYIYVFNLLGQNSNLDSAKFYYQNFEFQKSISFLNKTVDKDSEEILLLAKCYEKLGQIKKAKSCYFTASLIDTNDISIKNNLAKSYYQNNQFDSSLFIYQNLLILQKDNSYYWKQIGKIHSIQERPIEAIDAFQRTLELNKNDLISSISLAKLLIKINQYDVAEKVLENALKVDPNNKSLLRLQLKSAYVKKDYENLIIISENLFATGDSSLLNQKLTGIAYHHKKNYGKAIHFLEAVEKVGSKSEVLYYYLGISHREIGNLNKASMYLEKAINLGVSDNLGNYYTQLAVSYEEAKNFEKSIQAYKVAYKSTKNKILLYHLARNYDMFYMDKTAALTYYEKYLATDDSINKYYYDYSKYRIQELKTKKHFSLDTLD